MLAKCCRANNIKKELPISESTVITFVLWLANERNVKAGTINSYLAGIRQLHIMKGLEPPKMRTELVNLALKGKSHKDNAAKLAATIHERQPVTPDVLLLLKARLRSSTFSAVDQRLVWAVCTICFFGALRGAEIMCRSESEFDPAYTLLAEDVKVTTEPGSGISCLQLRIKAPKEDKKGRAVVIDIYPSRADICPVAAYQKWRLLGPPSDNGQPAFRWSSGAPLTGRRLNNILKERLTGYLDGADKYTVHSFRTGAASMMAALGYADEEIKSLGKWSSSAFENYIRLPRNKRRAVAKDFSDQFR